MGRGAGARCPAGYRAAAGVTPHLIQITSMPGEFELIRRYFTHPAASAVLGVGDDAALVRVRRGQLLVVSTDMLVAGTHFFADADPGDLGHKALAVNLSDMAAMGAAPHWATLSLALPRADTRWLSAFSRGFMRLARMHGVDLIGGDTTRGPLAICVQVMGEVPPRRALTRRGARVGDELWVSGTLGDAALALAAFDGAIDITHAEHLRASHRLHRPDPRVALGIALRGVASSAIDISDGLIADLGHICESSNVSAEVEVGRVPRSAILRRYLEEPATQVALLSGGDDYELCFTAPRSRRAAVERAGKRSGVRVARIGRITRAKGGRQRLVRVLGRDNRAVKVERAGFVHF